MAESKKELEDHVLVTHDPISCDAAAQIVHSDSAGATSMFIGECGLRSGAIDETVGERLGRLINGVTAVMNHRLCGDTFVTYWEVTRLMTTTLKQD